MNFCGNSTGCSRPTRDRILPSGDSGREAECGMASAECGMNGTKHPTLQLRTLHSEIRTDYGVNHGSTETEALHDQRGIRDPRDTPADTAVVRTGGVYHAEAQRGEYAA